MNRLIVFCNLAILLPAFAGCALFESNPVPPAPTLTGVAAQSTAWRDEIHRSPRGGTPTFGPLSAAEDALQAAEAQQRVEDFDSESLTRARQALSQAKSDWQAIADQDKHSDDALADIADKAHRAERLAQIAQYTAQREIGLTQLKAQQQRQEGKRRQRMMATAGRGPSSADLVRRRVVPEMLGDLHFQPGTAQLTQSSHPVMRRLAKLVQAHPDLGVVIFGFTSNSEPPADRLQAFVDSNSELKKQNPNHDQKVKAYQKGLSDARARDVAQLLVQAGVDANRIGVRGMGATHPVASNSTESGRRRNGRAEAVMAPLKRSGG